MTRTTEKTLFVAVFFSFLPYGSLRTAEKIRQNIRMIFFIRAISYELTNFGLRQGFNCKRDRSKFILLN